MRVINYFDSDKQSHWLSEIKRSDWGAARFLHELLIELKDTEWPFEYTDHDRRIANKRGYY